jgi:hypothetical protein
MKQMDEYSNNPEATNGSSNGERSKHSRRLGFLARLSLRRPDAPPIVDTFQHNEVDRLLIKSVESGSTTIIAAEEVALGRAPWNMLTLDYPETSARRSELQRWYTQLAGDIATLLELQGDIHTMSSEDIVLMERSSRRMLDTLWKMLA